MQRVVRPHHVVERAVHLHPVRLDRLGQPEGGVEHLENGLPGSPDPDVGRTARTVRDREPAAAPHREELAAHVHLDHQRAEFADQMPEALRDLARQVLERPAEQRGHPDGGGLSAAAG